MGAVMSGLAAKIWDWLIWGDPLRPWDDLGRLLEFTADFMDRHQLTWWLEWGTLLGAVRHGELIPWDYDLDAGMTEQSLNDLRRIASAASFPEGFCFTWDEAEGYGRFWLGNNWIDLVGYRQQPDTGCWQALLPEAHRHPNTPVSERYDDYPDAQLFPLAQGQIGARRYPLPRDAHAFLSHHYGDYWRLDRVPLLFSLIYHPLKMSAFLRRYRQRKHG